MSGDLAFSGAPRAPAAGASACTPATSRRRCRLSLELTNAAVSTAGSSEQHVDIGGRRYSHIIDPASRIGLVDDITVTVVARHGLDADGLDTAVSVLGVERGLALIESRPDAAALIVRRTPEGARVVTSSRFRALCFPGSPAATTSEEPAAQRLRTVAEFHLWPRVFRPWATVASRRLHQ